MPRKLADCLQDATAAGLKVDGIADRAKQLQDGGMNERDAGQKAINEFANDYIKGLHKDITELRNTIDLPKPDVKTGTRSAPDDVRKAHEKQAADLRKQHQAALDEKKAAVAKDLSKAPENEKSYHEKRMKLLDKYGRDIDEMIKDLKEQDRLKVDCPHAKFSLRNLIKR